MSFSSPLKTLVVAAILGAAFTGSAFARDQVFTAKLANPVAAPTRVIAESTVWNCQGDTCTAVAHHASTVHDCRLFVREAGPVVAYGPEAEALSSDQIARCNGTPQTVTAQNPQTTN